MTFQIYLTNISKKGKKQDEIYVDQIDCMRHASILFSLKIGTNMANMLTLYSLISLFVFHRL